MDGVQTGLFVLESPAPEKSVFGMMQAIPTEIFNIPYCLCLTQLHVTLLHTEQPKLCSECNKIMEYIGEQIHI